MAAFYGWSSIVSRLQNHYEETVYLLPLSSQEAAVLLSSTSESVNICSLKSKGQGNTGNVKLDRIIFQIRITYQKNTENIADVTINSGNNFLILFVYKRRLVIKDISNVIIEVWYFINDCIAIARIRKNISTQFFHFKIQGLSLMKGPRYWSQKKPQNRQIVHREEDFDSQISF